MSRKPDSTKAASGRVKHRLALAERIFFAITVGYNLL
jgi:hypothetical protein